MRHRRAALKQPEAGSKNTPRQKDRHMRFLLYSMVLWSRGGVGSGARAANRAFERCGAEWRVVKVAPDRVEGAQARSD
jgi:hypothetical protein